MVGSFLDRWHTRRCHDARHEEQVGAPGLLAGRSEESLGLAAMVGLAVEEMHHEQAAIHAQSGASSYRAGETRCVDEMEAPAMEDLRIPVQRVQA